MDLRGRLGYFFSYQFGPGDVSKTLLQMCILFYIFEVVVERQHSLENGSKETNDDKHSRP